MKRHLFLLCATIAAVSAGTAFAASPPTIDSTSHWNVGPTTAGLTMTFRNYEQKARVWFEYGTHSSLSGAHRVAEDVVTASSKGSGWHASLSGLQPNTVYYYRGFTRNYDGETYSLIQSFRTAAESARQGPSITFEKARMSAYALDLELTCNGHGVEGACSVYWSTSASMTGEREIKGEYIGPSPTARWMYASFGFSNVPDDTRIYVQGMIKTSVGTAKTGVRDFLIRTKPI